MRGPPPKPTAIRLLEGNPGKVKINRDEPQPRRLTHVEPPADFEEDGRQVFEALSRELMSCGVLTVVDLEPFARYVRLLMEYRNADREIKGKFFIPVRDKNNQLSYFIPNPWVSVRDRAMDRLLRLEREFGMTPAARVRMVALLTTSNPAAILDPYGDED